MNYRALLLTLTACVGLFGQSVEGLFDSAPRGQIRGMLNDNDAIWSAEQLLGYYQIPLSKDGCMAALRDARADIRSMAAEQLAKNGVHEAISDLATALSSEKAVGTQLHIANALAQLGDKRGVAKIEALCRDTGQSDQRAASIVRITALGYLLPTHTDACNESTIAMLGSFERSEAGRDANLRASGLGVANLLDTLSDSQTTAIREIAERWISDPDASVRQQASVALGRFGDAISIQKVKTTLAIEQDPAVRARMEEDVSHMERRPRADGK